MRILIPAGHTHLVSGITHIVSENPLTTLFSSRPLIRLLSLFLMNPDQSYYQQELVRATSDSLRPVQLALAKLEKAGLVTKRREGKQVYYRAIASHPVFPDLRSMFEKSFALRDVVLDALEPIASSIEFAFIYGSVASGQDTAGSDVDVMIIGESGRRDITTALGDAESHLGREINISLYTHRRLAEALSTDDPFISRVLESPKTWLVGDQHEFERMAR